MSKIERMWKACLVGVCLCLAGCMHQQIANIGSENEAIVCFGDSITQGFGAPPGQDYPAMLARLMQREVINAGIEGDTSGEALKRLDVDVLQRQPLLVVIELGANDFLLQVPLQETAENIETMVRKIQEAGAMVAIADVSGPGLMQEYAQVFRGLSRKYGAIYIPGLLSGIIDNPELKSDPFHPNKNGYTIIGHRVYRALFPHLNRNAVLRKFK